MSEIYYSDEVNVLMLISTLKKANIRRVIASPGTTNSAFVISLQLDSHFEIFSAVDERSAAYMACGMAIESNEPIVITCTGATASRNYLPGITEAYYKKLPILAVTGSQDTAKVGHLTAQHIDRSRQPNDTYIYSTSLPYVYDADSEWDCMIKLNKAIHNLSKPNCGPVHINLPIKYNQSFATKKLPKVHSITRFDIEDTLPEFAGKTINIFAGSGRYLSDRETYLIDKFCEQNNAYVIRDHASCYQGKYSVHASLIATQRNLMMGNLRSELTIHIGEITGDYPSSRLISREVWRVSVDGEIKDPFRRLSKIFAMSIETFFEKYTNSVVEKTDNSRYRAMIERDNYLRSKIPELPLSNIWVAQIMHKRIPSNSNLHLGILNSLRSWNFFSLDQTIRTSANVGGFGIDGCLSTLIGTSLTASNKLNFIVIGDLAAFYDMNVLGNRHLDNNIRILLINNGCGTEFKNFGHHTSVLGEAADPYVAANGHFGPKSSKLMSSYAKSLGFIYLQADTKESFEHNLETFLSETKTQSMIFEVFTESENESKALELMGNIEGDISGSAKMMAKKIVGKSVVKKISKRFR